MPLVPTVLATALRTIVVPAVVANPLAAAALGVAASVLLQRKLRVHVSLT